MSASIRTPTRLACALLLIACSDDMPTDPFDSAAVTPALLLAGGSYPTAEEFAAMPPEFSTASTIIRAWTKVGFIPAENRAFGQSFMEYFASNARQELELDLRFEHNAPISKHAMSESDDWLPAVRTLWTITSLGVMGACGHIVEGSGRHTAWHKFLVDGWKVLTWGTRTRSTGDSEFQPDCPPPPQDGEVDNADGSGDGATPGGEYYGECEMCQQWFYYIAGVIVDEWWECTPVDGSYCGLAAT